MVLPERLEESFSTELANYEESRKMRYVTSIERRAIQKGIEQGIERGLLQKARESVIEVLKLRFSSVPQDLIDLIQTITSLERLKVLHRQAIIYGTLEEFEQFVESDHPMADE